MAGPEYYRKRAEACALAARETEDWDARQRYASLAGKFLQLAEIADDPAPNESLARDSARKRRGQSPVHRD
jgi:hypothetical protein